MMAAMKRYSFRALALTAAAALALSACGDNSSPAEPSESVATVQASPSIVSDVPASGQGTRESPLELGTVVQLTGTNVYDELVDAADVTIGEANWNANDLFAAEDYTPEPGNVFVLVPVTVTLTASGDSAATEPDYTVYMTYVSPDGRSFTGFVNPLPGALENQPALYPGASATGDSAFEIPEDTLGGLWAVQDGMQSIDPVFVMAG